MSTTVHDAGTSVYYSDAGTSVYYSDAGTSVSYSDAGTSVYYSDAGTSVYYSGAGTSVYYSDAGVAVPAEPVRLAAEQSSTTSCSSGMGLPTVALEVAIYVTAVTPVAVAYHVSLQSGG